MPHGRATLPTDATGRRDELGDPVQEAAVV